MMGLSLGIQALPAPFLPFCQALVEVGFRLPVAATLHSMPLISNPLLKDDLLPPEPSSLGHVAWAAQGLTLGLCSITVTSR